MNSSTPIFSDDYTGARYTYGLRNRPLCIGTAPKGYIIGSEGAPTGRARWGTIQYPRQLTPEEIYDFELEVMYESPSCSQCGREFKKTSRLHGYSHCEDHQPTA
jgi:hypothetical protein